MVLHHNPGFLVVEGLDGAGTTTQAAAVAAELARRGARVRTTAEPSEGAVGRLLRTYVRREVDLDPETVTLLFTADRSDHVARVIGPALADGQTVVCDRYVLSTLAYQGAQGVDRAWIVELSSRFPAPGLTVYLDVAEDERRARIEARGPRERFDDASMGAGLRDSYLVAIQMLRVAGHRIESVDASGPPDEVTGRIIDAWTGTRG